MHLTWSDEDEAFREDLRAFLDEYCPTEAREERDLTRAQGDHLPGWARDWQATQFDQGWMIPAYPPELGGRNATPVQTLIYLEELAAQGISRSLHFGGYAIVGPSLLEFGNDAQKEMAPAAIRGDTVWCVGMSEPDAGSDLASLGTSAVEDGDSFIVNGQKVWTSYALFADKCFCYVRTDPDASKHKGISVLIIDLDTPGIEVRPLAHITNQVEFAEIFFDDVVVPRQNLVGELNNGWRTTMGSLAHERGGLWVSGISACTDAVQGLAALAKKRGLGDDPIIGRKLGEAYERAHSLRAMGFKGFTSFAQGSSAPEHSFMKLASSELRRDLMDLGTEILGPFGAVEDPALAGHGHESGEDRWWRGYFVGLAGTIGGGTSEIQRNVVATRVLGLPKA